MWEKSPFHFTAKFVGRREEITFSIYHKNHPGIQRYQETENLKEFFSGMYMPVGSDFFMLADQRRKIYDVYLRTFDYAVPQGWADQNYFSKGESLPAVVWCYDDPHDPENKLKVGNKIFGEPVYLSDLLRYFQREILQQYQTYVAQNFPEEISAL